MILKKIIAEPRVSFEEPSEIIEPGSGLCLDIGCGRAVHRKIIEGVGYQWIGLDLGLYPEISLRADALHLPFRSGAFSAVFLWQSLEHFEEPWSAVEEILRVLKPGGLLIGSTSFLEPFHDSSYFGFSEMGLRSIFRQFQDIEIEPGISSFILIPWTLFSRMWEGKARSTVVLLDRLLLGAFNGFYRMLHAIYRFLTRRCSAISESYWYKEVPYEFAGHLMFKARKPF